MKPTMRDYPQTSDAVRSYTMSRIKNKNTAIEVALRKALWKAGIRYRKNYRQLPGIPDIAITKHRIAIFCDGDFWHGRDWEEKKGKIHSNADYWIAKIERNMARDHEVNAALTDLGWTVIRFWGNDIKKNLAGCVYEVRKAITISQLQGEVAVVGFAGYARPLSLEDRTMVAEEGAEYGNKTVMDSP